MAVTHFGDNNKHAALLEIVRRSCDEQLRRTPDAEEGSLIHPPALEHYVTTYGSPDLPPSWIMVETLTIGQLTNRYRNLGSRADRTAVAKSVGLTAPVLESWMQTYVRLRNICAHHGRLWNVGLGVYPVIPTSPSVSWLKGNHALPERSTKRLHPVLVSLQAVPRFGVAAQRLGRSGSTCCSVLVRRRTFTGWACPRAGRTMSSRASA